MRKKTELLTQYQKSKAMIGESLTIENLEKIEEAMSKIKPIDRSEFFNNYYREVLERLKELKEQPKY